MVEVLTMGRFGATRREELFSDRAHLVGLLHSPGRVSAIRPRREQTECVPRRVAQPGLSPEPRLVREDGVELNACDPEPPYGFIETLALEKHDGAGFRAALQHLLERERAVPFRAFKPDIARQRINDESEPEALVEGSRRGDVDSGQGNLVEVHGPTVRLPVGIIRTGV
ncbi:MAG TPA: hypothetical protein VFO71_11970 [Gemmatimonadales bacterium]|nr:hypothetical protein [Gemmatimonadales bacterium]